MESLNLNGKVVLITGGGTGIGAAAASVMTALGAKVVLLGLEQTPLDAVAAEINGLAVVGDAADGAAVRAAIAQAKQHYGGLDALVTCAGAGGSGKLGECDDAAWNKAMRMSLDTAVVSARECLPEIVARRGAIVFVSSLGALQAPSGDAGYVTAKAALLGLTRSLATDYGPTIRVNAVCPAVTRTAMADGVMDRVASQMGVDRETAYQRVAAGFPLKRVAEPIEIARIIAFLISDWASYITGATIVADGGASTTAAML